MTVQNSAQGQKFKPIWITSIVQNTMQAIRGCQGLDSPIGTVPQVLRACTVS